MRCHHALPGRHVFPAVRGLFLKRTTRRADPRAVDTDEWPNNSLKLLPDDAVPVLIRFTALNVTKRVRPSSAAGTYASLSVGLRGCARAPHLGCFADGLLEDRAEVRLCFKTYRQGDVVQR